MFSDATVGAGAYILLFVLLVWLINSPLVLLWWMCRRGSRVGRYANLLVSLYVSSVLTAVLFLTGQSMSALVLSVAAFCIISLVARRMASTGQS